MHGDVKPANVLLTESKTVRLCDFGLSKNVALSSAALKASLKRSTSSTASGGAGSPTPQQQQQEQEHQQQQSALGADGVGNTDSAAASSSSGQHAAPRHARRKSVVGTPLYMAPEILLLQRRQHRSYAQSLTGDGRPFPEDDGVDETYDGAAADVYAFSILLYQLLTCSSFPVPSGSLNSVLTGARPHLPVSCPHLVAKLIADCWNQDPLLRPTFHEVSQRVEEIRASAAEMRAISSSLKKCSMRQSMSMSRRTDNI